MEKILIRDTGSAKNIPEHISKSVVTLILVRNAYILSCESGSRIRCICDPGSGMEEFRSGIRDKHPESEKLGYGTDVDYGIGNNWKPYCDEKAGLFIYAFYSCSGPSRLVYGQIWTGPQKF
jgi:hypothetical protein